MRNERQLCTVFSFMAVVSLFPQKCYNDVDMWRVKKFHIIIHLGRMWQWRQIKCQTQRTTLGHFTWYFSIIPPGIVFGHSDLILVIHILYIVIDSNSYRRACTIHEVNGYIGISVNNYFYDYTCAKWRIIWLRKKRPLCKGPCPNDMMFCFGYFWSVKREWARLVYYVVTPARNSLTLTSQLLASVILKTFISFSFFFQIQLQARCRV